LGKVERLHANIEVGTVDKFQGREAYVVFFATAPSSPDDAPRGMSFIFDRQRFNVAISRAGLGRHGRLAGAARPPLRVH
jgi:superfamily I DNA and/or RNA helicase